MALARSGHYQNLAQIRRQLQVEGYVAHELHSATLRNQVMDEIDAARMPVREVAARLHLTL
jgi:hypothetical protein